MTSYIGTPTSRVDGRAKVTGAAKYAAEFNVSGLAHASMVGSTLAKGRIVRVDVSEAMRVEGVIDVLTHEKRPRMADTDLAYKDDVAPEGSPFRPLYDDRILFSGQPIALVVAKEPEIAGFAAPLVLVDYDEEAHVTDVYRQRDEAFALESPANPAENPFAPPKPRGTAERAFAAAAVRHQGEYYVPIEHHNPMELYASTVIWDGGGDGSHAHNTHSAIFAEVKVDEQLGVIRATRVVSAVAAGRILNTKTAHSQIIGGVVWGIAAWHCTRKRWSITNSAGS